ncbi:hypothetical protein, partial [Treponema lecithinolyticum]
KLFFIAIPSLIVLYHNYLNFVRAVFYLTAKMLRAQRNFDGVLIAYSFIFLGVPCGLGGFIRCNLTALISVVVLL